MTITRVITLAGVLVLAAGCGPNAETRACELYAEAGGGEIKQPLEWYQQGADETAASETDYNLAQRGFTREGYREHLQRMARTLYEAQEEHESTARGIVAKRMNWSLAEVDRAVRGCPAREAGK